MIDLDGIRTEKRNNNTMKIDTMSTAEIVETINREDHKVADAVAKQLPQISAAVDIIYARLRTGGRLIYCGCGTSGRLGVLDAVECPPTYNTDPNMVQAIMAGGERAFVRAVEGAEDNFALGREDLENILFSKADVLVGIAASGRTPYVLGAMAYAHSIGADVISVTCCPGSEIAEKSDIAIVPDPGAEVVTGSTRMKSGSAQKMVLNMLSTAVMIKLGKVYSNLMVDVKATNEKLMERAVSIVCTATGVERDIATTVLSQCDYSAKTAIVMILCHVDVETSLEMLEKTHGHIGRALQQQNADKA